MRVARAFASGELSTHVNVGPDTAPETFELSNNLWFAHDEPGESEPSSLPAAESDGIYGTDPALSDAAGGDYHIGSESPLAGAGTPLAELGGDRDGTCYAAPPSIGAYEVGAP